LFSRNPTIRYDFFVKFSKKNYLCRQKEKGRKNEIIYHYSERMYQSSNILIKNRRAGFDYEISDRYTAGIQLFGTEIKSIRQGKAGLSDTYCNFFGNELWVKNMHIATYTFGTYNNHEVRRDRKLLLTGKELRKLQRGTRETGFTIVPTKLFINEKGLAKLEIGLAKGKKNYDKRQSLKEKEDRRSIDRAMKK
jgi:SsrA-binding protein